MLTGAFTASAPACPAFDDGSFEKAVRGLVAELGDYFDEVDVLGVRDADEIMLFARVAEVEHLLDERESRKGEGEK